MNKVIIILSCVSLNLFAAPHVSVELKASFGAKVCLDKLLSNCQKSLIGKVEKLNIPLNHTEDTLEYDLYEGSSKITRQIGNQSFKMDVIIFKEVSKTISGKHGTHYWIDSELAYLDVTSMLFVPYNRGGTVIHSIENLSEFYFRDFTAFEALDGGKQVYIDSTWGQISPLED
ncbi:MAG: hypothetical protein HON90_13205 [Halobacteriovoraceae bacterium]|jgi:hypothetical protein|nr:hypothetical protein [Halobacteriovoraceae bacterium]